MNRSCFLSFCCFAHTVQSLGHALPRSVSGACVTDRCSPSSAPFPPHASAAAFAALFGWFTGTTAQSDFSCTCMSAVRLLAFADRPSHEPKACWRSPGSRPCCFLSVRGLSRLRRTGQPLASNAAAVLPSSYSPGSRHPDLRFFEAQSPRPPMPPAYASQNTSRCPHARLEVRMDSLLPFLQGTCTPYNMPVYPGAQRIIVKALTDDTISTGKSAGRD